MTPLLLHCGSSYVSRSELAALPVPEARGPRHVVRPFADDVELTLDYFRDNGIQVEAEAYGVKRDADGLPIQFFGVVQVRLQGILGARDYGLMVGLRGSYDQSLARGLAVGSRVFCCDNLAFSGEITLTTKQTTRISQRLPVMLRDAVAQIPVLAEQQHRRFDAYRNAALTKAEGDHILVELVRREALAPSLLGRAIIEWDEPRHVEHAEAGRTLWRLHNAVTEAIKPANPGRAAVPGAWVRTRAMTMLLDEHLGLGCQLRQAGAPKPANTPGGALLTKSITYQSHSSFFPRPAVPAEDLAE